MASSNELEVAEIHEFDKCMKGFLKLPKAIDEGQSEAFDLV